MAQSGASLAIGLAPDPLPPVGSMANRGHPPFVGGGFLLRTAGGGLYALLESSPSWTRRGLACWPAFARLEHFSIPLRVSRFGPDSVSPVAGRRTVTPRFRRELWHGTRSANGLVLSTSTPVPGRWLTMPHARARRSYLLLPRTAVSIFPSLDRDSPRRLGWYGHRHCQALHRHRRRTQLSL